jgi:hypothetical protein
MRPFQLTHRTHFESAGKFFMGLAVLVGYFAYLWWKFDAKTGLLVAGLTWSFFVLCTPIRLLFKIRMLVTELFVWLLAATICAYSFYYVPEVFEKSLITSVLHKILITPVPYWGLIGLCAVGTFMSVHLGDEMLDVISHRDRDKFHRSGFWLRLISFGAILVFVLIVYEHLIVDLGVMPSIANH